MINHVKSHPYVRMGDLNVNLQYGWAFQADPHVINYDKNYFDNYVKLENSEISEKLNKFRCDISQKYCNNILDVGIGSGVFLKNLNCEKAGYDVNPHGVEWLKESNLYYDPYLVESLPFNGITLFDVLEHIEDPQKIFSKVLAGTHVIISIPIFDHIEKVQLSKHYKPNEHLYYFTTNGLVHMMKLYKFDLIEIRSDETQIGRENILTFVFRK